MEIIIAIPSKGRADRVKKYIKTTNYKNYISVRALRPGI